MDIYNEVYDKFEQTKQIDQGGQPDQSDQPDQSVRSKQLLTEVNRNNTSYTYEVNIKLKALLENKKDELLKNFQYVTQQYVLRSPHLRGQLIIFEMGLGKTRTSISIVEGLKAKYKILIFAAKSLQANYKNDIIKYLQLRTRGSMTETAIEKYIDENYTFISSNASNMFEQVGRTLASEEVVRADDAKFLKLLRSTGTLDGHLIVVDEAHNFFKGIVNNEQGRARKLYDMIMRSRNIKLLFLTGTPIDASPFELVPCFNMLHGYIYPSRSSGHSGGKKSPTGPDRQTLFPENWQDFYKYFISPDETTVINVDKFLDRITGLVSYYGLDIDNEGIADLMPKELPIIVERIPMSEEQYIPYVEARDKERKEASMGASKPSKGLQRPKSMRVSTYRVRSRAISNFYFPRDKNNVRVIDDSFFDKGLKKHSPKMDKLVKNVISHEGPGLIYSDFVENEGLYAVQRVLDHHGYKKLELDKLDEVLQDVKMSIVDKSPKYAVISGETKHEDRERIKKIFNHTDNRDGSIIKILMISPSGAEGLNLKNVRHIHILEPYWNYSRIMQVKSRGIRLGSHLDLAEAMRNVQVYIYLADHYKGADKLRLSEHTTDVHIYENSLHNKMLNDQFFELLKLGSIDCSTHRNPKEKSRCRVCRPTNQPLFFGNFSQDMQIRSPCEPYEAESIEAKEVDIDGQLYYYTIDNKKIGVERAASLRVFEKDTQSEGYVELKNTHIIYKKILASLV